MKYQAVIGLEVHAELETQTKMFCACPVVDLTKAAPNTAVCPVCSGMPGALPVVNRKAVEYAIKVALALECKIALTSLFARKNYFYPDLPKGYQISQYEYPLAEHGRLVIDTSAGEKEIRICRVHMEEDTGKLTHINPTDAEAYSLVDLNRSGISLLEIVSEPDMHSAEEVTAYATTLRDLIRSLGVNSGDMEKGVIRFEANVSLRLMGDQKLGTRVEIKNLNTFRGMERAVRYEIARQANLLDQGGSIIQETLGWDETLGKTYVQRSKEEAHDYRYFPEPDLPPLVIEADWIASIRESLPENPRARYLRFQNDFNLNPQDARLLSADKSIANYFEQAVRLAAPLKAGEVAKWITGQIFGWINTSGESFDQLKTTPAALVELLRILQQKQINQNTAKTVLDIMLHNGQSAASIISSQGYQQISDGSLITTIVNKILNENAVALEDYLNGKETLFNWFFGQAMSAAKGQADPKALRGELEKQLASLKPD